MGHFHGIIGLLKAQFQNQFFSGGIVLMVTGAIMALLRSYPARLWTWIKSQFVVEVDVRNSDPLFYWVVLWLNDHPYSRKVRRLNATTTEDGSNGVQVPTPTACEVSTDEDKARPRIILTPAKGQHLFWYERKLVWLSRNDEGNTPGAGNSASGRMGWMREETFSVRVLGRSQEVIRRLLQNVADHAFQMREKKVTAFTSGWDYWSVAQSFQPRPLESVVLPGEISAQVRDDMEQFIGRRDWYVSMGIPYRRGYLFHGVPGSGKTSLISALAGSLRLNLYVLSLTGDSMDDDRLNRMLKNVAPRSILLLEDIDAVTKSRALTSSSKEETKAGVTLTGLLNALDGVLSTEGVITVMTTNYKDRLDAALIRPGRVDMQVEFTYATHEQIRRLCTRFYPDDPQRVIEIASSFNGNSTMADVQCKLLKEYETAMAVGCA